MFILTVGGLEDEGSTGVDLGDAYLFFLSFQSSTPR